MYSGSLELAISLNINFVLHVVGPLNSNFLHALPKCLHVTIQPTDMRLGGGTQFRGNPRYYILLRLWNHNFVFSRKKI